MKNLTELGVKFLGGNSLGIANILVLNLTTGMYVKADGTETATLTYRTFDTYCSSNYSSVELTLMYWITLDPACEYDITVAGSGTKNASSSGYTISLLGYVEKEAWVDAHVHTTLRFWHTEYPAVVYDFTAISGTPLDIVKTETIAADGFTNMFTLSTSYHAYEFTRMYVDGEWLKSYDTNFTWGSNSPYYNDETMDSVNKGFTVYFVDTPVAQDIILEFKPYVNTYKIFKTYKLPEDSLDSSIVATATNIRELSYAVEVV